MNRKDLSTKTKLEVPFNEWPQDTDFQSSLSDPTKGPRIFFRKACLSMRARFEQLFDHNGMARVFLHGNPHHDNFAGFPNGSGLIDFDRSVIGAYAWDLVRFYASTIFWGKNFDLNSLALKSSLIEAFLTSYLNAFNRPDQALYQGNLFQFENNNDSDRDLAQYIDSKKKWAKDLHSVEAIKDRDMLNHLLEGCFDNYCFTGYKKGNYRWTHYSSKKGSMGNNHHIFLLKHTKLDQKFRLVDIKTTYTNPNSENYFSPYNHEGIRMILAAKLYAPKLEQDIGYVTFKNKDYWARMIRPNKKKVKAGLCHEDHLEVCRTVGSQLGNGHRRSLFAAKPSSLTRHLEINSENFLEIAVQLTQELAREYQRYLQER